MEKVSRIFKQENCHGGGCGYSFNGFFEKTPFGKYLYIPYGPYLANAEKIKASFSALKKVAKENDAFFVRIEPTFYVTKKRLKRLGARKSKDLNPAETWVFEIPEEEELLLKKLPRRMVGYYNNRKKKDIEIVKSHKPDDIKFLVELQAKVFSGKNISPYSEKYLKEELKQDFATLYLAKVNKKVIAAVMVFDYLDTRYYMQAASDKEYAKLNANGILTIKAILDAREDKKLYFDFWGIAPEGADKSHPWYGFTAFKKKFEGREVRYSGTYDIPIKKFKYLIYTIFRKINLVLRRHK